jgi:hypothetical protein
MKKLDIKWIKEHYTLTVATEGILDEVYDNRVAKLLEREKILSDIADMIDYACDDYLKLGAFDIHALGELLRRLQTLKEAYLELEEAFF